MQDKPKLTRKKVGLHKQVRASNAPAHMKTQGSLDSLRDAVDYIASAIAQYGLKP